MGVIDKQMCFDYGLTGPVLRASGFQWDLRKNRPYLIYKDIDFEIPVGTGEMGTVGDCWDRYIVRMREMEQSRRIVEQLIDNIPTGPIRGKVAKKIRAPKGEVVSRTECPRGELAFYIVSDGGPKPYRVKVKSPCLLNISTLDTLAPGQMVADLVATIGSLDIVLGEIDR